MIHELEMRIGIGGASRFLHSKPPEMRVSTTAVRLSRGCPLFSSEHRDSGLFVHGVNASTPFQSAVLLLAPHVAGPLPVRECSPRHTREEEERSESRSGTKSRLGLTRVFGRARNCAALRSSGTSTYALCGEQNGIGHGHFAWGQSENGRATPRDLICSISSRSTGSLVRS